MRYKWPKRIISTLIEIALIILMLLILNIIFSGHILVDFLIIDKGVFELL